MVFSLIVVRGWIGWIGWVGGFIGEEERRCLESMCLFVHRVGIGIGIRTRIGIGIRIGIGLGLG